MPKTTQAVATQLATVSARRAALDYIASQSSTDVKVADRYDDDDRLRDAIGTMMPDFEYPDISHLTLAQLHRKCQKLADPVITSLKTSSLRRALNPAQAAQY